MRKQNRYSSLFGYPPKRKSRKPMILKIVFIVAAALLLIFLAVRLGQNLNERAKNLETRETLSPAPFETPKETEEHSESAENPYRTKNIKAFNVDPSGKDAGDITALISDMSGYFNCASVNVSKDGNLIYISKALLNFVKINPDSIKPAEPEEDNKAEDKNGSENILDAVKAIPSAASEYGMSSSAVFENWYRVGISSSLSSSDATVDSVIVKELSSFGYTEILLKTLFDEELGLDESAASETADYISFLKEGSPDIRIGIMVPYSYYSRSDNIPLIGKLAECADFLAVNIDNPSGYYANTYSEINDRYYSLSGIFASYKVRGIIYSSDESDVSQIFGSLSDMSMTDFQFVDYSSPVSAPQNQEKGPVDDPKYENENARREEYYETETEETVPDEG